MGLFRKLLGSKNNDGHASPETMIPPNAAETPVYQGDYAKAVFLWALPKSSSVKKGDEYPRYILSECGIQNASAYHLKMIQDGFLQESQLGDMIAALTVADIKSILSDLGLSTSGKREVLVQRAVESMDSECRNYYFPAKQYSLSDTGKAFLSEHEGYILLHKHRSWDISWQEFDANSRQGRSANDTVWGILNGRIGSTDDFGRHVYYSMYELLLEEGRRSDALLMLLRVFYIDLSGVQGLRDISLYRSGAYKQNDVLENFGISITLAPGIVSSIEKLRDAYSDEMITTLFKQKLPVHVCDQRLFTAIVRSILDGSYDNNKAAAQLKQAFNKTFRGLMQ